MAHKIVIDRIEEQQVVCIFENGKECALPIHIMPDDASEGDVLYISLEKNIASSMDEQARARALLDELMNISWKE